MIFVIYIKWEENRDKFMAKYANLPQTMRKIIFQSKCKKGKFEIEKIDPLECIILPTVNEKILKKLGVLANIRCWKNICVSENLRQNSAFNKLCRDQRLQVMDGRWLFKNMMEQVVEYLMDVKNEMIGNQEISILCHKLDEWIAEKIKEIAVRVKVCNILTNHTKQFQKLEDEIYLTNGVMLNVSNNYKKTLLKSSLIINFDFSQADLEKCIFGKKGDIIQLDSTISFDKKDLVGQKIIGFGIDMPEKYAMYQEKLEGFNGSILYESLIYKHTSYKNIQKELLEDDARILYLQDSHHKIIQKPNLILPKTLDKMMI